MMILIAIGSGSFVLAALILFWWHPNTSLDVRIALAGIYLLAVTVAVAGVSVLMRLDSLLWRAPQSRKEPPPREISQPLKFFTKVTDRLFAVTPMQSGHFDRVTYASPEYDGLEDPPGAVGFVKRSDLYSGQQEIRFLWMPLEHQTLKPFCLTVPGVARLGRRSA
jgi:hypothetical protein